ncbi:unnamed protein product, partial [Ixodes pacificus]
TLGCLGKKASHQPGIAQAAFEGEWESTDCEDRGAALSFQRVGLHWQPLKTDHGGRTDAGATSAFNLTATAEITPADWIKVGSGDKLESFGCDGSRGDLSSQTNWWNPHKQRTHRRPDKHRCRFCPYSSYSLHNVRSHERTHTGERPFSCSFCQKTFAHKCHKKSHERIHTGETPFKCETCGKAFKVKSSLHVHRKVHGK